ncbi:nuclear transport factor 2 family protein [Spirosoma gilvum]
MVDHFIAEGDFVTAIGRIHLNDETGEAATYSYCDVWQFRDGKMAQLKAFVIKA